MSRNVYSIILPTILSLLYKHTASDAPLIDAVTDGEINKLFNGV